MLAALLKQVNPPVADWKVNPVGMTSMKLTPVAVEGPLFVTTIVYCAVFPRTTVVGPVLAMETSAEFAVGQSTVVRTAALVLLLCTGSVSWLRTEAVLLIVPCVQFVTVGTLNASVKFADALGPSVPVQETMVVPLKLHAGDDEAATKVRPVGITSVTTMLAACTAGPAFVTVRL
jgi:hypothetical protein